jgi:soluble lytic murein transglycosylase-like protein
MRAAALLLLALSGMANASCWVEAGSRYDIHPAYLYGIARVESSLNAHAVNRSHYKKTSSYDIGLMQINSRNLKILKNFGITENSLYDACTSIQVGAWLLREKMNRYPGNMWLAVGAYNAACTSLKGDACLSARRIYAWKVYRAMLPLVRKA